MRSRYLSLFATLLALYVCALPACGHYNDSTCHDFNNCGDDVDAAETNPDAGGVTPPSDAAWECCPLDGTVGADGNPGDLLDGGVPDANQVVGPDGGAVDANPSCGDAGVFCGPTEGCVDVSSSTSNCGGCGHVCPSPGSFGSATCGSGHCGIACQPNYEDCGDAGVCLSSDDVNNCGGCGHVCPSPANNGHAVCDADGGCEIACNSGDHLCNGQCLPNTDPPSTTDPCVIDDPYAIFVSPRGLDTNAGTKEAPVQTIAKAVSLATTKASHRVIACATAGTYTTALLLSGSGVDFGAQIYGGVSCPAGGGAGAWTYTGQKALVAPTAPGPALQVSGLASGITIVDFEFDAQPGNAAVPGDSSVGAFFANTAGAVLQRVKIVAKDGVAGTPGATFNNAPLSASLSGGNATSASPGAVSKCGCTDGTSSTGGAGGGSAPAGGVQAPGAGLPAYGGGNAGTNGSATCTQGNGDNAPATAADGTGAAQYGSLTSGGWAPLAGTKGSNGQPGQGGGGGGGEQVVGVQVGQGGGGACGGCGGGGGTQGSGGGSSIALLAYSSNVSLLTCQLVAGNGKQGGQGGSGAPAAAGGVEGLPYPPGCPGGNGAAGAGGNGGGGGAGGLSLGVGYVQTAPIIDGATVTDAPTQAIVTLAGAGTGGPAGGPGAVAPGGGNAGNAGTKGIDGVPYAVKALP
jgi:hypothetical protein